MEPHALTFLLPVRSLPPEDGPPLDTWEDAGPSAFFLQASRLVKEPVLIFDVVNVDPPDFRISFAESGVELEAVALLGDNEVDRTFLLDIWEAFVAWNAADVEERLRARLGEEKKSHIGMWIAEVLTDELTRQERFTELNGSELNQASLTAVPLFRWSHDGNGINGALLGFWLRSRTATNTYGAHQERLASCRMVGITDEEEVSGRGVPEIVASLALFGIASSAFLAQDASAGTDSLGSPDTITSVAPRVPSKQRFSVRPPSAERRFQQEPIKTYEDVLGRANAENTHVVVSISRQRAYLMVGDEIAIDSPISSGRAHRTTGTGTFTVTEKDKNHISSKYHCPMKYFLRLSDSAIGLHVGQLPGYPASHGCVRLPQNAAKLFFENATVGTSVSIEA